jgi:hypothetical protein
MRKFQIYTFFELLPLIPVNVFEVRKWLAGDVFKIRKFKTGTSVTQKQKCTAFAQF